MKLFSYWRSLATFRVRIAMNLKGIKPDEIVIVDLVKGDQRDAEFRAVNPQMAIPALVDGEGPALIESLAIIEYLDELHPVPPLLPPGARARARVRGLAQIVACDCHPLVVPRVRNFLADEFKLDEAARLKWLRHWVVEGLKGLEGHLARDPQTGRYCHGDSVTIADLCLVSHAVGAQYFQCDIKPYPTIARIVDTCMTLDAFASAHPLRQPDAPKEGAH